MTKEKIEQLIKNLEELRFKTILGWYYAKTLKECTINAKRVCKIDKLLEKLSAKRESEGKNE